MLKQKLQQRLLQKLSPQQVLVMRLLQEPLLSFEQRIKQEIEENPALEEADLNKDETDLLLDEPGGESIDSEEDEFREDSEGTTEQGIDDEFGYEDYLDEEEIPDYKLLLSNKNRDEEFHEIPLISRMSFQDYLLAQAGMQKLTGTEFIVANMIIGNLDEAGYLRRDTSALIDDLAFNHNIHVSVEEVEKVLKVIQGFDPHGVGARNLQECLLIQLQLKPDRTYTSDLAEVVIQYYFDDFSKKHFEKIMQKAHITEEELKDVIDEITKLNPKPGESVSEISRDSQYVVPDFVITNTDGELDLSLNTRNSPDLMLNRDYITMLQNFNRSKKKANREERAAISFIKQKIDAARGFIDAIHQRQQTLLVTMQAIMDYQHDYFLTGDETKLKPMILKDIATRVNLDISTISRVANSKYVQTPFGTILLKSFFSESMQNIKGEEVSTREIKKILSDIIEGENKSIPMTDDDLMEQLRVKGYNVARRTIAKYRKLLNIPVARLRKQF
jgi:RNA polymerase sigma-54 factor